jgi:signal transduction histidine kinase
MPAPISRNARDGGRIEASPVAGDDEHIEEPMKPRMLRSMLTRAADLLRSGSRRFPRALAIALGFVAADPDYAGRLRAAQIGAIVRLTPLTMAASCLNAAILLATIESMGEVHPLLWLWSLQVFALAFYYGRNWLATRHRDAKRPATLRAVRRAIIHGGLFGGVWGVLPVLTFPGAAAPIQLLVGCLTVGMMCAGAFVLATVPLAGMSYVLLVGAGAFFALLADGSPVYLGLTALTVVYTGVVIVNLNWNAFLFVSHFLAEAQLRKEVAAREQAQAQAAHAERMIALGELAGGIAHDFNNLLQAIAGSAGLIERRREDPEEVRRRARLLLTAVERGGSISRRLLAFARRDILVNEPVDPEGVLKELCDLLGHTLGSGIAIRMEAEPGLPALLADKAQLETVLLNLATNARDAMPQGGDLTFTAVSETMAPGKGVPDPKTAPLHPDLGRRQRDRHGRSDPSASHRAVFHDQAQGPRHRARSLHGPGLRRAIRWRPLDPERTGKRHDRQHLAAAGGRGRPRPTGDDRAISRGCCR